MGRVARRGAECLLYRLCSQGRKAGCELEDKGEGARLMSMSAEVGCVVGGSVIDRSGQSVGAVGTFGRR